MFYHLNKKSNNRIQLFAWLGTIHSNYLHFKWKKKKDFLFQCPKKNCWEVLKVKKFWIRIITKYILVAYI